MVLARDLAAQLERAWEKGFAVMLSPVLSVSGVADWHGRIAIYVFSGDPRRGEPWRAGPCSVEQIPAVLKTVLEQAVEVTNATRIS